LDRLELPEELPVAGGLGDKRKRGEDRPEKTLDEEREENTERGQEGRKDTGPLDGPGDGLGHGQILPMIRE
jgi:hypothetical protein